MRTQKVENSEQSKLKEIGFLFVTKTKRDWLPFCYLLTRSRPSLLLLTYTKKKDCCVTYLHTTTTERLLCTYSRRPPRAQVLLRTNLAQKRQIRLRNTSSVRLMHARAIDPSPLASLVIWTPLLLLSYFDPCGIISLHHVRRQQVTLHLVSPTSATNFGAACPGNLDTDTRCFQKSIFELCSDSAKHIAILSCLYLCH